MGDRPIRRFDTLPVDSVRREHPGAYSEKGASPADPAQDSLAARLLGWIRRPSDLDIASGAALPRLVHSSAGSPAGIEYHELIPAPGFAPAHVVCTDYCEERFQAQEVADMDEFLGRHRPIWSHVRWVHVDGLQGRERRSGQFVLSPRDSCSGASAAEDGFDSGLECPRSPG